MSAHFIKKTDKGFTIIETLVAVTILMIAMTGPLTIAHRGLLAAAYASQQVTASYLAQDGIEFVKNVKDNNRLKAEAGQSVNWLTHLFTCTKSDPCSVETSGDPNAVGTSIAVCGTSCQLYTSDTSGYTHVASGARLAPYSRYFYLDNVSAKEAKLVMIVSWSSGTLENVFAFENEIFDIQR